MDIYRETFAVTLEDVVKKLNGCDFYAVDLEMTGIRLAEEPEDPRQTLEEAYAIKRKVAERYNVIQVGICTFRKKKNNGSASASVGTEGAAGERYPDVEAGVEYEACPFNFYLFPHETAAVRGRTVSMDADTLAFLRKHGMDFQKWIYRGVPYCDAAGEAMIRKQIAEAADGGEATARMIPLEPKDQEWLKESLAAAHDLDRIVGEAIREVGEGATADALGVSREITIKPNASAHARQSFKEQLLELFPQMKVARDQRGRGTAGTGMQLQRLTPLEHQVQKKEAAEKIKQDTVDRIGFRHVWNAMKASKRPIVAHNSFSDFLFLWSALEGELPETLSQFHQELHEAFPMIVDTKHLSRAECVPPTRFPFTALGMLFDCFTKPDGVAAALGTQPPPAHLPAGYHRYNKSVLTKIGALGGSAAHEAGYDAYMTGVVYLGFTKMFGAAALTGRQNHIAVFRSLYALAMSPTSPSIFLYQPIGALYLVRHPATLKLPAVESLMQSAEQLPLDGVVPISETETLALMKVEASPALAQATAALQVKHSFLKLTAVDAPHDKDKPKREEKQSSGKGDSGVGGGGGAASAAVGGGASESQSVSHSMAPGSAAMMLAKAGAKVLQRGFRLLV